jgi:hypothetical protein
VYRGYFKGLVLTILALMSNDVLYASCKPCEYFSPMDTLIIDGDTIFIERQEGLLISDSTGLTEPEPSRLKRPPLRIWNAAVAAGFNTSITSWKSQTSDFESLDEFLGRKTPLKLNPLIAAEFGGRFASIRTAGGVFELSVNTGIALNQVVSAFTTISESNQLVKDSILGFGTEANELFVTYFTVTNPPDIGEVDTAFIDLQGAELKLNVVDIPLKLRVTLQPNGSNTRMFLETGVMRRLITRTDFTGSLIMLNERGEFHQFLSDDFQTKRILAPHFGVGAERRIPMGNAINQKYYALGALLSASIPGLTWNNSADLSFDVGSVSLTAFARFFF